MGKVLFAATSWKDRIRYDLVRLVDPKLADLPRCRTSRQEVPVDRLGRMMADFKRSYYHRRIDQVLDPGFETPVLMHDGRHRRNQIFWRKWTAASLVEELIGRGVRVLAEARDITLNKEILWANHHK